MNIKWKSVLMIGLIKKNFHLTPLKIMFGLMKELIHTGKK